MKKGISVMIAATMAITLLAGCGGSASSATTAAAAAATTKAATTAAATTAAATTAAATTAAATKAAAATTAAASGKQLTFALLPKTLTNPYFVAMQSFAQKECDKYGIKLDCTAPTDETKVEDQIAMFETELQKGVDGILIVPCGTDEIVSSIEAANKAKIPVICLDTNANGGDVLSFIGTDNFAGGKLAGEWVAKNIKSGTYGVITGTPGNKTHEDRQNGFLEGVKSAADMKQVGEVLPAYSDRAQGMTQAETLITAYPDLKVIYVTNDTMALGAAEAVANAGKADQVTVIGFDGSPDGAKSILEGGMDGTVAQTPGIMAQKGVDAMYEYLTKGTKPEKTVYTDTKVVTKEDAKEYLDWH